jgi:uncharacterized membrane protein
VPKYIAAIDLAKNELRNARIQNLATAPSSPVAGQLYYDTALGNLYFSDGSTWYACYQNTSQPTGAAGGSLTGTYPNPTIATGAIVDAMISASAAIQLSKLAVNPLARANHTGTQTASTISDFNAAVQTNRLDQMAAPTAAVSMNGQRLSNLLDPTSAQDAATKNYVDSAALGLDVKASVRAVATSNITLSGTQSVDGVTLAGGDRVLVIGQSTASQNGIYIVSSGAWARASDAAQSSQVTSGLYAFVEEGSNSGGGFILTTPNPITLGTTNLAFTQFTGAGEITAGAGLTKTGNSIDAVGTTNRISVFADYIDIAATYVGQTSITTLGTITTGTWNGTAIGVGSGGTGGTTPTQARANIGAITKGYFTNGGTTTDQVPHGLGSPYLVVSVYDSSGNQVFADVKLDATNITVTYASAPAAGSLTIVYAG